MSPVYPRAPFSGTWPAVGLVLFVVLTAFTKLCWVRPRAAHGGGGLVTKSCPTLGTLWTVALQAPQSMGFFRQEYRSGLPFPSPRAAHIKPLFIMIFLYTCFREGMCMVILWYLYLVFPKKQILKSVPYRKLNFLFYSIFPEISMVRGSLGKLNSHSVSLFKTDLLHSELDCKAGRRWGEDLDHGQSAMISWRACNPKISPQNCTSLGWWRKASHGNKITTKDIYWGASTRLRTLHRLGQLVPSQHCKGKPYATMKKLSSGMWGHSFNQHLTLLRITISRDFGFAWSKIPV